MYVFLFFSYQYNNTYTTQLQPTHHGDFRLYHIVTRHITLHPSVITIEHHTPKHPRLLDKPRYFVVQYMYTVGIRPLCVTLQPNLDILGSTEENAVTTCIKCGKPYSPARAKLGIQTCLICGDYEAVAERMSWCVAQEYNKGAYQLVTNPDTLKQTNPKRTT